MIKLVVDLNILRFFFHKLIFFNPRQVAVVIPRIVLREFQHQADLAKSFIMRTKKNDPRWNGQHQIWLCWKRTQTMVNRGVWEVAGLSGGFITNIIQGVPNDWLVVKTALSIRGRNPNDWVVVATLDKQMSRAAKAQGLSNVHVYWDRFQNRKDFELPIREA